MKIVIIDNEKHIIEGLTEMINILFSKKYTIFSANGVEVGYELINQINPDIVFLDVELDDGTGMDLLQKLESINFQLIFITAHNKYAIEGFKFSAIDFLLKPVLIEDLHDALNRAEKQIRNQQLEMQLEVFQESLRKLSIENKKIALKDSESIHFVKVSEIIRCQSDGPYTEFYTSDKKIVISKGLKEYEEILEPFGFVRVHNSHLVNISKILRFDKINGVVITDNGEEIPVSQRKREQVVSFLSSL